MTRATTVQMRESLVLANELKKAMIRFVPMPVADEFEYAIALKIMQEKLDKMAADGE